MQSKSMFLLESHLSQSLNHFHSHGKKEKNRERHDLSGKRDIRISVSP